MARIWDVFRPKGVVGFSPRVLTLGLQFGHLESSVRGDLCPEGGYRTRLRVSTLGTLKINEFALKGREAEQINLAPIAAQKLECAIETCTI
jgi:hypothetical protein